MQGIIIVGRGGHARVLLEILLQSNVTVLGFVDDNTQLHEQTFNGIATLGTLTSFTNYYKPGDVLLVNGVGSRGIPTKRKEIYERFKNMGYKFHTTIHPSSSISPNATLAEGVQVIAGAVVSTGCEILENCILNTNACIGYESKIEAHTHIAPGATLGFRVSVGKECLVGIRATVDSNITLKEKCLVGAGAVVVDDFPANSTLLGNPARPFCKTRKNDR
ncbi:MAG: acetyltransferase [Pseudodesulfovibrio sp.]|nr:acetyltransferase [Pseudodesulfovibrio sp.]